MKCDKPKNIIKGKWTTIYDQALKLELDNGLRFLTNFRYNAKPALSKDPLNDQLLAYANIHSGDYGSFISDCS